MKIAACVLLSASFVATKGARAAEPVGAPVERVFGVRPGTAPQELQAMAGRLGVDCRIGVPVPGRDGAGPSIPFVCPSGPHPLLTSMWGTFWYEQERLARAFLVDATPLEERGLYRRRFDALSSWLGSLFGPPATAEIPPDWAGARPLPERQQLAQLLAGRARLSMTWQRPEAIVSLWLAGENGHAVVVIGMYGRPAPSSSCAPESINEALLDLFPPAAPAARARAANRLSACRVPRAEGALGAALAHDPAPEVQARALDALDALGKAPPAPELARLQRASPPALADAAREILARERSAPATAPTATAPTTASNEQPIYGPPAAVATTEAPTTGPAPSPLPLTELASGEAASTAQTKPLPQPIGTPPAPRGPLPGTPLAIGASTVAGAALMRNIGAMGGLSSATPQLLLGSAGAVIGFGTSWGLSRFGVRPTIEQAAWYTNTTAWGTFVGLEAWNVSGSHTALATYGLPAAGEALGMGLGVWSARKWPVNGQQLVLSDTFLFGAALSSLGFQLMRTDAPTLSTPEAVATPFVMAGAVIGARALDPTTNDVHLMLASATGLGWSGGLLAAGALDGGFLGSHQSWGGVSAGLGVGYLAGAALGPFVETDDRRLALAGVGLLGGNALGLGLHLAAQGFSRDGGPGSKFSSADVHARALSAGLGGLVLAGAGYAYEPYLRPGPSAASLTLTGTLYGAGTWWLASAASYHGQPLGAADDARLYGGLLTGATLGGLSGLVASRWFAPSGREQAFAAGSAGLGLAGGLGVAKLLTDAKGTPDAVGVLLGTGVGLTVGARLAPGLELRAPDDAGGALGLGTGLLVGTLAPTLGASSFEASRRVAGAQWLGLSLGTTAGLATAHLTHATGGEVGVTAVAGVLGLGVGAGVGFVAPCGSSPGSSPCTSQAPRIGATLGPLALMGGAMALEPHLHLASTLGPDATTFAVLGGTFGAADGLLLAGALSPTGVVSGAPARQAWGGVLLGSSTEVAGGLVASKYLRLRDGDALVVTTGKLTGGLFGLGAALLAKDRGDAAETLATLAGSVAGESAAAIAQTYTPLDRADALGAASGAGFGAFVGALAPTLGQPRWNGLGTRDIDGGLLLGLSAGAIAGAASSHASRATPHDVGLATLGGLDGLASGLGVGLLFHDGASSRPERLGLVVGTTGGLAVGALAWPRLHLDDGDVAFTAAATGLGGWTGYWAAALGHASASDISDTTRWGGVLAGAGLSSIAASLMTPALTVDTDLVANAMAVDALWSGAGAGAGALLSGRDDAPVWGLLGGGTAGLVLGGVLHDKIDLKEADAPLLAFGGGHGAWLGGWVPMLLHADGAVSARQRGGALALGAFGGLGLTTLLSPVVHPDTDTLANAVALEALWAGAGAGAGALVSAQPNAPVWGLLGAGTAGLFLGGALHEQIKIGAAQAPLLGFAGAEGLWLGGWIPSLVHENGVASDRERFGALALGGFGAVGAATLLSAHASIDDDTLENAAVLEALWTGAGAGAGALASTQANAPVWGMLGAGTAGMLLGGALHEQLTLERADAPLLTLAGSEGVWFGGWLPYVLHDPAHVTSREQIGALALGGFGGLGAATLASAGFELSPARGGLGATGSAIGASIGGGLALLSPSLHGQGGVGLMLSGTTLGLVSGLALGPSFEGQPTERLVGAAAVGAGLGVSQSLLFAWSGRASGNAQYGGAALTGAGVGSALGLAMMSSDVKSAAPAAAGFAAWGAWTGAFTGSLFANDPHQDVMGGLIGANVGFFTGYALLRNDVVEPRDFGWLSLFGALGTVAGAGVAAPFSNGSTTPVRAGLAIGPIAGMFTGALVLPTLRRVIAPAPGPKITASERRPVTRAANDVAQTAGGEAAVATDDGGPAGKIVALAEPVTASSTLGRRLSQVGGVTDWQPLVGAMPAPAEQGPAPLLFGVTGHWR